MANLNSDDGASWGKVKESADVTKIFYYSFFNEGLEYALYDNVEIYDENKLEPHIGKIMKLWEEKGSGKKQVLIRWYFKAFELLQLNSDENSKELFLAFGKGKGVINVNDLHVIYGKCKVLCTSEDPKNRQPSENDLKSADYFFSNVYNVDRGQLSAVQRVADKLGYDVVFNKQEWVTEGVKTEDSLARPSEINPDRSSTQLSIEGIASIKHETTSTTDTSSGVLPSESKKRQRELEVTPETHKKRIIQQAEKQSPVLPLKSGDSNIDETGKNKKLKVLDKGRTTTAKEGLTKPGGTSVVSPDSLMNSVKVKEEASIGDRSPKNQKVSPQTDMVQGKVQSLKPEKQSPALPLKRDNSTLDETSNSKKLKVLDKAKTTILKEGLTKPGGTSIAPLDSPRNSLKMKDEAASGDRSPKNQKEKRRIFKELPWEENLHQGLPYGRVVLVQNFDPLVTSADVRDMMKSIFNGFSDARVVPHEKHSSSGEALVIFDTKMSAESALQAIESKCLVLSSSRRPLIASRARVPESSKISRFPGHLLLEKYKLSRSFQNEDMRRAVATSHCSQPNTIEFEMAIEWRLLQEVAQLCKVELFRTQLKEIEAGLRKNTKKR